MSDDNDNVAIATELTIAWLANPNNRVSADDVPAFLAAMYKTVGSLSAGAESDPQIEVSPTYEAAVSVRKSLASKDHIISMIDGKPYRTLKRHLTTNGLTPDEYRERYGLKADYPMVAESYSEARRSMAKQIGLGRKPAQTNGGNAAAAEDAEPAKPKATRAKLKVAAPTEA